MIQAIPAAFSEVLCHVCLGSGEYVHRNYRYREVGRETCTHCNGTGRGLISTATAEFLPNKVLAEAHSKRFSRRP